MLEKIIKKEHQRIIWSFYGVISMVSMLLPLAMLGIGIWFQVSKINSYGILWMVVGAVGFLFSLKKMKDFLPVFAYAIKPKKFKAYQALINDGLNPSDFDEELEKADVLGHLSKKEPLYITEHFVFGFSQVQFFFLQKNDIIWAYEYNGNGLVFLDSHGIYGFTFFQAVDGNDLAMKDLEHDMPYIYFGTDFDYHTIMHDNIKDTILNVQAEREKFLLNPEQYRSEKEAAKKAKIEEETKRLEDEKNRQMAEVMKGHADDEPIIAQVEGDKENKIDTIHEEEAVKEDLSDDDPFKELDKKAAENEKKFDEQEKKNK